MASLRHTTVESGIEILSKLYLDTPEEPFFTCNLKVLTEDPDRPDEGQLPVEVKRKLHRGADYVAPNGDRYYRTVARFPGDTREFVVDVVILSREADATGASLLMNSLSLEIFTDIKDARTGR